MFQRDMINWTVNVCVSVSIKSPMLFPAVPQQAVLLLAIRDTLSCGQTACLEAVHQIKCNLQKDGLPPYDQANCDFFFTLFHELWYFNNFPWKCWLNENSNFGKKWNNLLHLVSDNFHNMRRRPGGWLCRWKSAVG